MAKTTVAIPDIGGTEDAEVIEISVAVGDRVELEQGLIVLESDKASMEIPSTAVGTVTEILVKEGDKLAEGAPIAVVEVEGEGAGAGSDEDAGAAGAGEGADESAGAGTEGAGSTGADESAGVGAGVAEGAGSASANAGAGFADASADGGAGSAGAGAAAPAAPAAAAPAADSAAAAKSTAGVSFAATSQSTAPATSKSPPTTDIHAGPAVRKLAREFGVELGRVPGTGPKGRILKEDVQSFVKQSLQAAPTTLAAGGIPPVPEVDFAAFGEIDVQPLTKTDKLTGQNMQRSWLNAPHVTQFDDVDVTSMEDFRAEMKDEAARRNVKLTPLPFLLKACAVALRDNPRINASLMGDGERIAYKRYVHIGMAVDTPAGLLVPVIRDVDRKSLWELADETAELAAKARDRKLKPAEMRGGCFTISSLGNIGGTGFTPVINVPEVAILGVSRLAVKPVWNGDGFEPRKLLPLALSYDHRVVNGADGGRFMSQLAQLLADIRRLVL